MIYTYTQSGGLLGDETVREEYSYIGDKTVNGKIYRGYEINSTDVNKNDKTVYYNCTNGVFSNHMQRYDFVQKQTGYEEDFYGNRRPIYEYVEKPTGKYLTWSEFKAGAEKGDSWTEEQITGNGVVTVKSTMEEKGLTITVKNKTYTDVIKITREVSQDILGTNTVVATQEVYYAKGVGRIKTINGGNVNGIFSALITNTEELVSYSFE